MTLIMRKCPHCNQKGVNIVSALLSRRSSPAICTLCKSPSVQSQKTTCFRVILLVFILLFFWRSYELGYSILHKESLLFALILFLLFEIFVFQNIYLIKFEIETSNNNQCAVYFLILLAFIGLIGVAYETYFVQ